MKNIFLIALAALFAITSAPVFAANVTVEDPVGIWDNSTGVLQGFGIPGQGQSGYTAVQTLNSAGGVSLANGTVSVPSLNFISDPDTGIYRIGANNLGIAVNGAKVLDIATGGLSITGAATVSTTLGVTGLTTTAGVNSSDSLTMTAAAKTLVLKQGANGKFGTVTCTSSTPVTVANSSFTANSVVIFSLKTVGGTVGSIPRLVTATPSTGFDINCTASDTSVYNYAILESAS